MHYIDMFTGIGAGLIGLMVILVLVALVSAVVSGLLAYKKYKKFKMYNDGVESGKRRPTAGRIAKPMPPTTEKPQVHDDARKGHLSTTVTMEATEDSQDVDESRKTATSADSANVTGEASVETSLAGEARDRARRRIRSRKRREHRGKPKGALTQTRMGAGSEMPRIE